MRTTREMTTPLFLLRCMEIGVSVRDMDLLTIGLLIDIFHEKGKDGEGNGTVFEASQRDMDLF